ncbi:hypothetical protein ACFYQQ_01155 [Streptomyces sp. NPDC005496]|uniref:hypothetical protein n=1 Tax=unclassified Streptomyces TaxID=2593676 RepID=UPI0033B07DA4
MSTTPPPPEFPPPASPEPPAPAKRNRTHAIIIGSAAAVIAAVIATGIVVVQSGDDSDSKPAATRKSSAKADDGFVSEATEEAEPTYADVTADDFTMKLKTKEKQCFGSAGCNLTVEPDLAYDGVEDIDPAATYEITYEIRGGDSGPVIETAELSDETTLNYTPTVISTTSSSAKLTVEITDVTEQGT